MSDAPLTPAARVERTIDVCVVGAGPHALSVVTHLITASPSRRNNIVALDPSGEWLTTWRSQFERLEIDVLRSPMVHHPGVEPGSLARHVAEQRLPRSNLPYDPPLTNVFESFCNRTIEQHEFDDLLAAERVIGLRHQGERTLVTTDAGSFSARQVIWTGNTCEPMVPAPFTNAWRRSPAVLHASEVDLRRIETLDDERVVIVGGGLSAGHLAVGALRRGADVTLTTRRPIVERNFDVEPGWLGPKHLDAFSRIDAPIRRLEAARSARGGGSMPPWMHRRLRQAADRGRLAHIIGAVSNVEDTESGLRLTVDGETIEAGHCWLATGTRPDIRSDRALAGAVDEHVDGTPIVDAALRVAETGLFVTGRLATIELGPAAGNLWGARLAARRICRELTGIDLDCDAVASAMPPAPRPEPGTR